MNGPGSATGSRLYSPRLLMLSARLAEFPYDESLPLTATARSRTCGSSITLGIDRAASGEIARIGMMVTACAVGQSSAAILADAIVGTRAEQVAQTRGQIELWLKAEGEAPLWPQFDALVAARDHPGRHGALLLPWTAAVEALSSHATSS